MTVVMARRTPISRICEYSSRLCLDARGSRCIPATGRERRRSVPRRAGLCIQWHEVVNEEVSGCGPVTAHTRLSSMRSSPAPAPGRRARRGRAGRPPRRQPHAAARGARPPRRRRAGRAAVAARHRRDRRRRRRHPRALRGAPRARGDRRPARRGAGGCRRLRRRSPSEFAARRPSTATAGLDAYYALIARFDAALDAAVANDYLTAALRTVRTHLVRVRRLARDNPARLAASVAEHRLIASAIAARDADLAAHATHVHLHNALTTSSIPRPSTARGRRRARPVRTRRDRDTHERPA